MATLRDYLASKPGSLKLPPPAAEPGITTGIQPDDFPQAVERPLTPMAASYLETLREVAKHPTAKILIIGCRLTNLGVERVRSNPKLILWESSNAGRWSRAPLPVDVGAVIALRWIAHKSSIPLETQAKKRGVLWTGVLSTGDVRQLIDLAFKGVSIPHAVQTTQDGINEDDWRKFLASPNGKKFLEGGQKQAQEAQMNSAPAAAPTTPPAKRRGGRIAGIPLHHSMRATAARFVDLRSGNSHREEAARILAQVQVDFPDVTAEQLGPIVGDVRRARGIKRPYRGGRPRSTDGHGPVRHILDGSAQAPAPVAAAAPALPQDTPKATAKVSAQEALAAIDKALVALQQAGTALTDARTLIVQTKASMDDTILKEVEEGVMQTLIGIRERFSK